MMRPALIVRSESSQTEKSDNDQHEDDHQKNVDQIPRLGDARNASRSDIAQKPEDEQDNDYKFEHASPLL